MDSPARYAPGNIRDAIIEVLMESDDALTVEEIKARVAMLMGPTPSSSIRSSLRLKTPELFQREARGRYRLRASTSALQRQLPMDGSAAWPELCFQRATLINTDCFEWLAHREPSSIHGVVTDPPYGLVEYTPEEQSKLRNGKGGVWRIPPSFDGHTRSPLPRFTTLTPAQLDELYLYFNALGKHLLRVLVPGGHVVLASNPLLSFKVSSALAAAGLERRGELVRLTMTMRGGDRPKDAHEEFAEVSVMPRSMWEPWLIFRRPLEGRVQDNLRKWRTGGFRRPTRNQPFGDVIRSHPTSRRERKLAPHPSLKPQAFMRSVVRAVLPLGTGIVLDPFAGCGSTLAASESLGYASIGVEIDSHYFSLCKESIPLLAALDEPIKAEEDKSNYLAI